MSRRNNVDQAVSAEWAIDWDVKKYMLKHTSSGGTYEWDKHRVDGHSFVMLACPSDLWFTFQISSITGDDRYRVGDGYYGKKTGGQFLLPAGVHTIPVPTYFPAMPLNGISDSLFNTSETDTGYMPRTVKEDEQVDIWVRSDGQAFQFLTIWKM